MKEFIEKLLERLEEIKSNNFSSAVLNEPYSMGICHTIEKSISIINKLAEEYKDKYVMRETLNQYMWERDVAISQLNDLGFGFGEKVGWIPCSERLPEDGQPIIATFQDGRVYQVDFKLFLHENPQYAHNNNVIAWMPLPEPFRPKE